MQAKKEVEPSSFKAEGFFDDDEEEDGGADDALGVMGSAMKKGLGDAMGKAGSLTDKLGDKLPVSSDKLDGIKSMTGKLGDKVSSDKLDGIKGMSVSSATGALTGGLTSVMNMSGVSGVTVTDHDLSMGEEAPLSIKANAKAIYHVPVKQAEGALMWNFTVGKDVVGDIRFSVTFKSNSATASEDAEAIDGWADSRHDAEEGSKKGMYTPTEDGVLNLEWCNAHSKMRSKTVLFRVRLMSDIVREQMEQIEAKQEEMRKIEEESANSDLGFGKGGAQKKKKGFGM